MFDVTGVKRKMKVKDKKEQLRKLKKKRVTSTPLSDHHVPTLKSNMVTEAMMTSAIKANEGNDNKR